MRSFQERRTEIQQMPTEKLRRRYLEGRFGELRPFVEAELSARDIEERSTADARVEARAEETLLIARLSKAPNLSPNTTDKYLKLKNLITEIESQSIKFDSDNWPQFQIVCVEWGDKVAPLLNLEEKNQFNQELDRIRAVIHEPILDSDRTGAPKSNNFKKMLSIAKQRQHELELENKSTKVPNPTPNPPADQTNIEHNWQNKILIYIAVGVVIVILGTFAIHLIKKHFGIPL